MYNIRREECMEAAQIMGKKLLREVSYDLLRSSIHKMTDEQYKRAEHVISENERVLEAKAAAHNGDIQRLGELMKKSHKSSRFQFENSTPDLDFLVDTASNLPGCYGCRLTGGGWGGATVNLVEQSYASDFSEKLAAAYKEYSGLDAPVFTCTIANGAQVLSMDD
jgi:galactokinase